MRGSQPGWYWDAVVLVDVPDESVLPSSFAVGIADAVLRGVVPGAMAPTLITVVDHHPFADMGQSPASTSATANTTLPVPPGMFRR